MCTYMHKQKLVKTWEELPVNLKQHCYTYKISPRHTHTHTHTHTQEK